MKPSKLPNNDKVPVQDPRVVDATPTSKTELLKRLRLETQVVLPTSGCSIKPSKLPKPRTKLSQKPSTQRPCGRHQGLG